MSVNTVLRNDGSHALFMVLFMVLDLFCFHQLERLDFNDLEKDEMV